MTQIERTVPVHFHPEPQKAYEIISDSDETVLIGIDMAIRKSDDRTYLVWFDTTKERIFDIKVIIIDHADLFVFVSSNEHSYAILPLTFERFKTRIVPRHPDPHSADDITTEDQMITALFQTIEGS